MLYFDKNDATAIINFNRRLASTAVSETTYDWPRQPRSSDMSMQSV